MNHQAASSTLAADGQQSVIAQDDRFARAERARDAVALGGLVDHAGEIVEQAVVLIEGARVLRDRVEQAAERRPGLAVDGVGVRRRHGIGPRSVNARVDGEGGSVDRMVAVDDFAVLVHQHQV